LGWLWENVGESLCDSAPYVGRPLENSVDIEWLAILFNQPVIKNTLLQNVDFSNICPAFTTTVYAFLNPKLPSAAWDFFCLRFGFLLSRHLPSHGPDKSYAPAQANPYFFDYY
jgi:hypothetical protein